MSKYANKAWLPLLNVEFPPTIFKYTRQVIRLPYIDLHTDKKKCKKISMSFIKNYIHILRVLK